MARMGRQKLENPRTEGVFIRLTKDEHTDITDYAITHDINITKTQSIKERRTAEEKRRKVYLPVHRFDR